MSARAPVECPNCQAKLNLPETARLGKRIKCPKCSEVFSAAEATGDSDDDSNEPARPAAGKKRTASGAKGNSGKIQKSRPKSARTPLILGGVFAALTLIGVGLYLSGFFSPQPIAAPQNLAAPAAPAAKAELPPMTDAERILGLRWMPQDIEGVFHVKVAELWKAPLLQLVINSPEVAPSLQSFQKMTGLQPSDVESVSIGMGDPQGIAALPGLMGQPIASSRALTVIRSKKPLVPEEWLSQQTDFKPAEHNSKKYFESSSSGYAAWIAEPTTLLMAGSSELKAAMDRGETVIPRKELLFMDPKPHVVVIGAPKNPRSAAGLPIPLPDSNPGLKSVQSALGESMTAFGLGLNIRGGFDVLTSFAVRHPPDADAVKSGLNASLAEGKKALQDVKSKLPPLLMELGESLISNVRIEAHSQIVSFNTGLPDSDQQKIEQVPTVVMSMLVLGGLAADGNPFGSSGDPLLMAGLGPEAAQPGVKPDTTTSSGSRPQVMGLDWSLDANGQTQYWAIAATTAPESTSGLIDNTSLTAKSAWAMSVPQGTRAVRVLIDLQGDGLSAICGYGQVTVSEITCKGSRAKVKPEEVMPRQILGQVLFPFDPADGASNDSPHGTLRLAIPVELPDATASALEKLEGTFKVLTCDGREQYMIDDAVKTAKRPLNIPGLKGAGVKLSYPIGGESLTVSWAPEYFLSQIRITAPADSIGPGMKNRFDWELEKNKPRQKLYARSYPGGRIPDKLQLQFNVCRGVKEKTVAFKFSNIALPAPEAFAPDAGWLIEGPRPGLDSSRPK